MDEDTGLYYGARYGVCPDKLIGNPRVSMWWGVDPLAHKAPGWTPYRYAFNNPIRIIDPDGQFETRFGAWLYNASRGFKGKVHESLTRPGEYYVGRQIKSSTDARYDIKWSGNTEKPVGGYISAIDKVSSLLGRFLTPNKFDRSANGSRFGQNLDETNGGIQFSLQYGQGGETRFSQNADVGPALDDMMSVVGVVRANGNTLNSAADQIQFGADILQTVASLGSMYSKDSGDNVAVDSTCNLCGGSPHGTIRYNTYNKSGQVIEANKILKRDE